MASILATRYPDRVDVVVPIASGFHTTNLQALHNFEQMLSILRDPGYQRGDYYGGPGPVAGLALARQIAAKSPNAIRAAKRLCTMAHDAAPEQVLVAEATEQAALLGKPEQMEVIAAQFGKRAPVFR